MSLSIRLLLAAFLLSALAGGQVAPRRFKAMPPEIVKSPPHRTTVELDNAQMHVVRHQIAGLAAVRSTFTIGTQGALVVAVTPLDLRVAGIDGKRRDVHVGAGLTEWIPTPVFMFQNISGEDAEFLLIEAKK